MFSFKNKYFLIIENIKDLDLRNIKLINKYIIIYRNNGKVEIVSGLNEGDQIVAEGLKKVRPKGKIKPIKN